MTTSVSEALVMYMCIGFVMVFFVIRLSKFCAYRTVRSVQIKQERRVRGTNDSQVID